MGTGIQGLEFGDARLFISTVENSPASKMLGNVGTLEIMNMLKKFSTTNLNKLKVLEKGTVMEVQLFLECLLNILWKCCSVVLICIGCF